MLVRTAENASFLTLQGNDLLHVGGNAVFLSNSVSNVTVRQNRFSFLGTSGVSVVGRTGASMMDARDGEAMAAAGGLDNGVRLPMVRQIKPTQVSANLFQRQLCTHTQAKSILALAAASEQYRQRKHV